MQPHAIQMLPRPRIKRANAKQPTSLTDKHGRKIVVVNGCNPTPWRSFDWEAHLDCFAPEGPRGHGAAIEEAIANFLELIEDQGDE